MTYVGLQVVHVAYWSCNLRSGIVVRRLVFFPGKQFGKDGFTIGADEWCGPCETCHAR
jgi:hypothetical protein